MSFRDSLKEFYKNKTILITGHSGFKGTWMCHVLMSLGAKVAGYSKGVPTEPSLFKISGIDNKVISYDADVRNLEILKSAFAEVRPDIVIHMAAQPIVRDGYKEPVYTYETNVMGTVNVLECVRLSDCVKSFINVTTDKVYLNKEWTWGYRENEELNGFDPYSNSKSCSELVTSSYRNSFFRDRRDLAVSTCRAGNVIGGGDFANDRIIPDCVRAIESEKNIEVRNPFSTRPYQHVLEPVVAYLILAMEQYKNQELAGSYNIGPDETDCVTTGELVTLFCNEWNRKTGSSLKWVSRHDGGPHEAGFLKLDCSKIKSTLGWHPVWHIQDAMRKIAEWTDAYLKGGDVSSVIGKQIEEYLSQL